MPTYADLAKRAEQNGDTISAEYFAKVAAAQAARSAPAVVIYNSPATREDNRPAPTRPEAQKSDTFIHIIAFISMLVIFAAMIAIAWMGS